LHEDEEVLGGMDILGLLEEGLLLELLLELLLPVFEDVLETDEL